MTDIDLDEFDDMYEQVETLIRVLDVKRQQLGDILSRELPVEDGFTRQQLARRLAGSDEYDDHTNYVAHHIELANDMVNDAYNDLVASITRQVENLYGSCGVARDRLRKAQEIAIR